MPDATPFAALGAGNGFPFCVKKADVSMFHYKNPMTLQQAMKFLWSSYSITATASIDIDASSGGGPVVSSSISGVDVDTRLKDGVDKNPSGYEVGDREPSMRVCSAGKNAFVYATDDDELATVYTSISYNPTTNLVMMYDGSVDDEGNFIGYGFGTVDNGGNGFPLASISIYATDSYVGYFSGVYLYSFAWNTDLYPDDEALWWQFEVPLNILGIPPSVANETLGGTPFVKAIWGPISADYYESSATLTGLSFYTYPA